MWWILQLPLPQDWWIWKRFSGIRIFWKKPDCSKTGFPALFRFVKYLRLLYYFLNWKMFLLLSVAVTEQWLTWEHLPEMKAPWLWALAPAVQLGWLLEVRSLIRPCGLFVIILKTISTCLGVPVITGLSCFNGLRKNFSCQPVIFRIFWPWHPACRQGVMDWFFFPIFWVNGRRCGMPPQRAYCLG